MREVLTTKTIFSSFLALLTINDEEFVGRMFLQLIPARLVTLYGDQIYRKISLLPAEIVKEIQNNVSGLFVCFSCVASLSVFH